MIQLSVMLRWSLIIVSSIGCSIVNGQSPDAVQENLTSVASSILSSISPAQIKREF